jgi:hypothetical protein
VSVEVEIFVFELFDDGVDIDEVVTEFVVDVVFALYDFEREFCFALFVVAGDVEVEATGGDG